MNLVCNKLHFCKFVILNFISYFLRSAVTSNFLPVIQTRCLQRLYSYFKIYIRVEVRLYQSVQDRFCAVTNNPKSRLLKTMKFHLVFTVCLLWVIFTFCSRIFTFRDENWWKLIIWSVPSQCGRQEGGGQITYWPLKFGGDTYYFCLHFIAPGKTYRLA